MKLNIKKVIIVILILLLVIIGIWAGISLTKTTSNENIEQESYNTNTNSNNLIENIETSNSIDSFNNSVINNIDITINQSNNILNNNTANNNITSNENINNEKKEDLNSYLEKFSLICYLDSRMKDVENEVKRNEDYIYIAMHIAKESNELGTEINGREAASKETINNIISEIRGRTIENMNIANILYSYDDSTEQYYSIHDDTRIAHIIDVIENVNEDGVIKLKYTCCFPNESQLENNNFSGLGTYVISMELKENSSYKYSKYRIQDYEFVVE